MFTLPDKIRCKHKHYSTGSKHQGIVFNRVILAKIRMDVHLLFQDEISTKQYSFSQTLIKFFLSTSSNQSTNGNWYISAEIDLFRNDICFFVLQESHMVSLSEIPKPHAHLFCTIQYKR
jgi:hypothetical protein